MAPAESHEASVVWVPPTLLEENTNIAVSHDHTPGDKFPIGDTVVTYMAYNFTGASVIDTANCTFVVRVLGK